MYSTCDLGLAAALTAVGRPVDKITITKERRGAFNFAEDDSLEFDIDDYWQGRMLIEPKTYQTKIKELKTRVNEMIYSR